MTIYPAIDLKDGKCVRLLQGDYSKQTVYSENPVQVAHSFKERGAGFIHIVDLDAARTGEAGNLDIIAEIVRETGLCVQTGGGIRTLSDVERRLEIGVKRVIIGTAAVRNPDMVARAVGMYGLKIAVGIDARDGIVMVSGWEQDGGISAGELCRKMGSLGVKTVVYTDIKTDGMMKGTDIEGLKGLISLTGLDVIASGGISCLDDIKRVKEAGAAGVIVGQAIYKGVVDLREAIELFGKRGQICLQRG